MIYTINIYIIAKKWDTGRFTKPERIKPNMTYGDLIQGWVAAEAQKNRKGTKKTIDKQFEYNRFIRDYFEHETQGNLKDAIKAWKRYLDTTSLVIGKVVSAIESWIIDSRAVALKT